MKLVVIAIDGLSMEIITRSHFPVISEFDVRTMESTIPYITPPGWTSCWTGLNPSHHGIMGIQSLQEWRTYGNKDRILYVNQMKEFKHYRIWDYLATEGMKCVVRDVPLSLPIFNSGANVGSSCHSKLPERFWRGYGIPSLPEDRRGETIPETVMRNGVRRDFSSVYKKAELYPEFLSEADEIDVLFLGFHETDPCAHLRGIDSEDMTEILTSISSVVEKFKDHPILIVSDHGFETYRLRLNLENFLKARQLFVMNGGGPDFKKSIAYPVDCGGKKKVSTQEFGIYINTKEKKHGFVQEAEAAAITTELIIQLGKLPDITAIPKWKYYDPAGEYYECVPDILVTSNNCRTFIQCPFENQEVLQQWGGRAHSRRAIFATNFSYDTSNNVKSIEEVYRFICDRVGVEEKHLTGEVVLNGGQLGKKEEEAIKERLKELGYITK